MMAKVAMAEADKAEVEMMKMEMEAARARENMENMEVLERRFCVYTRHGCIKTGSAAIHKRGR